MKALLTISIVRGKKGTQSPMSHTMRSWCLEIIFPQCQYLAFPPAHTFNYRSTVTRHFLFSFHNCCIASHVMSNNETKDKIPIHLSKKLNQNVKKSIPSEVGSDWTTINWPWGSKNTDPWIQLSLLFLMK